MEAYGKQLNGSNTIEYLLPEEIITEILLRLPVKSLLRFSSVCKSWRTLISSPYFTKTHLNISKNSKNYANHNVILYERIRPFSTFTCPLPSILDNNATLNLENFYLPTPECTILSCIYGNRNGLLCVQQTVDDTLILYNPSTRKSKILPASGTNRNNRFLRTYGLCYYQLDDDYRVVEMGIIWDKNNFPNIYYSIEAKIYSLRTNSWRKINGGDGIFDKSTTYNDLCTPDMDNPGLPIGDVLHWSICNNGNVSLCQIFGVDIVTYSYVTLDGPKYVDTRNRVTHWGIMDFGGCLGVYQQFDKTGFDIWILKESWTKVMTVPDCVDPKGYDVPIIGLKAGQILLSNNKFEYSLVYDSREGSFIHHNISNMYRPYITSPVYIESLVAPSFDGENNR